MCATLYADVSDRTVHSIAISLSISDGTSESSMIMCYILGFTKLWVYFLGKVKWSFKLFAWHLQEIKTQVTSGVLHYHCFWCEGRMLCGRLNRHLALL